MVHVIFALANCVEACVMPLIYTLEWISLKPGFVNYTWWWFHSSACLLIQLTLNNALGWSLLGVMHVACPHIWLQNHRPPIRMLLVSTCASTGLVCYYNAHNLWFPVFIPVAYWPGYAPVGGCIFLFKFHSINIRFVIDSWGYITGWSPLVWYQL